MEKTIKTNQHPKAHVITKTVVVPIAITISIALLVYLTNMLTPTLSFGTGESLGLRASNVFRALALSTPWAATGISLGSMYTNYATGKSVLGFFALIPAANLLITLVVYKLAKTFKTTGWKEHAKNIAILIAYAVVITIITRLNHTFVKFSVFSSVGAQAFFWQLMLLKSISNAAIVIAGYPLFLGWKRVQDKIENPIK
jgi:hypothetical protein